MPDSSRRDQTLQATCQHFHLEDDIARLWDELGDQLRAGMALVHESGLNVVLTVARGGQHLGDQQPKGAATVHVLQGRLRILVDGDAVDCEHGELLALDANVPREIEVLEDTAFLTTVALAA